MDQARVFIAIVLSFLVFFMWEMFFVEKQAPQPPAPAQENVDKNAAVATSPTTQSETQPAVPAVANQPKKGGEDIQVARSVAVTTPLMTTTISEQGAVFASVRLSQYRESIGEDAADKELIEAPVNHLVGRVGTYQNSIAGMEEGIYTAGTSALSLDVIDAPKTIGFRWASPEGIAVVKEYTFYPDSYAIDARVTVENYSSRSIADRLFCRLAGMAPEKNRSYGFQGASALINGSLEQIKSKKIKKKDRYEGLFHWAAIQDRYFMKAVLPENEEAGVLRLALGDGNRLLADYAMAEMNIAPGSTKTISYQLFFGPRSVQVLEGVGHRLDEAIDFGWFDFIAKPCVWFMNFIYEYVPNYGIAIIILTLIVKLLLWPLGNKSYKSMSDMKKLQPLMAEIREKHQNDKQKMNQELMGLYRTYKINPMGGCLPMFLQIPVFIALYRMLYEAIELRHAPFVGWINDLSAPDRLFHFNFTVPLMEPPYGIPVLTIVMGATMLLQQKMSPPMGDPMQAKMMMLMPLVFTFIFINFPSGLVLYWLVNNVLSIAQQYYVQKKFA